MTPILYTYATLGARKAEIIRTCEEVAAAYPKAWAEAHNGSFDDRSREYNRLCALALRAKGIYAGLNGKRGNPDTPSDDILNFPLAAGEGGAQDKSGRFPEIAIIDYIIGAGDPDIRKRSIGWIDQSAAAPGYFLDPKGQVVPFPAPPPPSTPPTPVPVTPPAPACQCRAEPCPVAADIAGLYEAFSRVAGDLQEISANHNALVKWLGGHLDEIKQSQARLESKRACRFL